MDGQPDFRISVTAWRDARHLLIAAHDEVDALHDAEGLVAGVAVEREAVVTKHQIRVMTPLDRRFLAASTRKLRTPVVGAL